MSRHLRGLSSENENLKRALSQSEELRSLSIQLAALDCSREMCELLLRFMLNRHSIKKVFISHIGAYDLFSMNGCDVGILENCEFMQHVRHGKINYEQKVCLVSAESKEFEKQSLTSTCPVQIESQTLFALVNIAQSRENLYSFLFTLDAKESGLDAIYFYRLQQILEINLLRTHRSKIIELELIKNSEVLSTKLN